MIGLGFAIILVLAVVTVLDGDKRYLAWKRQHPNARWYPGDRLVHLNIWVGTLAVGMIWLSADPESAVFIKEAIHDVFG